MRRQPSVSSTAIARISCVVTAAILTVQPAVAADPLSPEAERATFALPADLEIQLVAAEPDVADPVHISWDEAGRMYVCEMGDYPAEPSGGLIKRLEDRDGDGRIDHSQVFADGLHYPTSTLPYRGGVLVSSAPDILYLKDTNNDGQADVRKVLFTGFGEGNQQLRVNSLIWGLDGWVYGANGRSDGEVRCVGMVGDRDIPDGATTTPVSIRGRDFRFQPELGVIEPTAGFSQFGHAFDDYGNRFLSWNTVHIRHVVLDPLQLLPGGHLSPQEAVTEIADHGSTGRIFPASTTTKRFNAEEPGFFNASCGLTIYRGDALPAEYRGNAFCCEPLSNLVHRDILKPDGVTFIASRAETEKESEFLTSTDSWFRPVNLTTGPDGALYVVDFYRELVEHPQFVANVEAREKTDFRKGHDVGRIWRIVSKGHQPSTWASLSNLDVVQLVSRLSSSNAWERETAQRLVVSYPREWARQSEAETQALNPALERAMSSAADERTRIHALWTAAQVGGNGKAILAACEDTSPRVQEHAALVGLSSRRLRESDLQKLASSSDPRVRPLAVRALGQMLIGSQVELSGLDPDVARNLLARLWKSDGDDLWYQRLLLASVENSFSGSGESLAALQLAAMAQAPSASSPERDIRRLELVERLASIAAAQDHGRQLHEILKNGSPPFTFAVLHGMMNETRDAQERPEDGPSTLEDDSAARQLSAAITKQAAVDAADSNLPVHRRVWAIRLRGLLPVEQSLAGLQRLVTAEESAEVVQAAVRELGRFPVPEIAELLVEHWPQATPSVRRVMLDVLLTRREFIEPVVSALEDSELTPADFDNLNSDRLLRLCNDDQRARAQALLSKRADANRAQVIQELQSALNLAGDPVTGAQLFVQNCQTCHAIQGVGKRIGPDLASVANRPSADVLVEILDPSRNVAPDGMSYVVSMKDGRVLSGLLGGESFSAITLRRSDGEDSILRSEIEELRNTGRSLMPEGFEKNLSAQSLADLLAFLKRGQPPAP